MAITKLTVEYIHKGVITRRRASSGANKTQLHLELPTSITFRKKTVILFLLETVLALAKRIRNNHLLHDAIHSIIFHDKFGS